MPNTCVGLCRQDNTRCPLEHLEMQLRVGALSVPRLEPRLRRITSFSTPHYSSPTALPFPSMLLSCNALTTSCVVADAYAIRLCLNGKQAEPYRAHLLDAAGESVLKHRQARWRSIALLNHTKVYYNQLNVFCKWRWTALKASPAVLMAGVAHPAPRTHPWVDK